jgi:hypothetical protein
MGPFELPASIFIAPIIQEIPSQQSPFIETKAS